MSVTDMAVMPDALFVVDVALHGGSALRIDKATGATTVLASDQSVPLAIAADASGVYWANSTINDLDPPHEGGAIYAAPLAGGEPHPVRTGLSAPEYLALNAQMLVWTAWDGYHVMPRE